MQYVHVRFASGETNKVVRLDRRINLVRAVGVFSYVMRGFGAQDEVSFRIRGFAANVSTEGRTGFPLPVLQRAPGVASVVFQPPVIISMPNKNTVQQLEIDLRTSTETPFVHTGLSLWLVLYTDERTWSGEETRALQNFAMPHNAMSGAGNYDTRWDYIPSTDQVSANLASLSSKIFSERE